MEIQVQDHRDRIDGLHEVAPLLMQPVGSGELDKEHCSVIECIPLGSTGTDGPGRDGQRRRAFQT